MFGNGREFAEERLGDLAVGRDDDFAGLAVDDVERNLFAEEDVRKRFGQTLAEFVHLRLVLFLDLLALAATIGGRKFLLLVVDAGRDLHVHDDASDTRRNDEGGVLNVGGLFTENGAEELFLGREFGFGLRSDFADEDVARLYFRTDANDAVVIE